MSKRYHLWTIGCQMNDADSRHLGSQLEALGYRPVAAAEDAELVILNTCVVRQQAEDKALGRLQSLKSIKTAHPELTIGLMGCLVGMKEAPRLKQRFPFVDVFMPPSDTEPLLDFLARRGEVESAQAYEARARAIRTAIQDEEFVLPALQRNRAVTANVPIVLGCSHACTFCVIPYRRGAERSRPADEILREIRSLVDQGVREVMLLGQIVDRYGTDLADGPNLAGLLRRVAEIDGLLRIRFLTSHPSWMTDELLDAVADSEKVCPHIEVPVQAGNDEVLAAMRRGYTAHQYRSLIGRIRERIPDAAVNTDIIVGFPGETEAQFMDTVRLLDELRLDKVHIAKYSVRPKTLAARSLPDDVPEDEKERRRKLLDDRQAGVLAEKNAALRGRAVRVLVEDRQRGRWRGRTGDNRIVFFEDDRELRGEIVDVRIEWTGPFSLLGRTEPRRTGSGRPATAISTR